MSGIIGSLFNHRGSGIVAKLGTDGHTFNSGGAGKKAVSEAVVVVADGVDGSKIADDAVDSEHYTDGSIDNAHIADDAIDSEHYADGSIDNAHIADDAIDSEHYAAASIDNAHLADNAVDTAEIADNAISLAKMAGLARGKLIYGDSSGDPAALSVGSANEVLTHDGTDFDWAAAAGGSGAYDLNGETLTLDADGDTLLKADVDDQIIIELSGSSRQVITTYGQVLIGDTATNQGAYPGVVLNQGAGDGRIFDFKSSDVAHNITDQTETDNWGQIHKVAATEGGMVLSGFSEGMPALVLSSAYTGTNSTYTTGGVSAVKVYTNRYASGTQTTTPAAGDNLFGVYAISLMRFSVDNEGDLHYDGSASAYDHYDDAQLVRALDTFKAPEAIIQGKFDKFVKYNRSTLEDSGVLYKCTPEERERGETPFICITKLQKLHNGAIWQQYTKHNQLLEAVYDLAKEAIGEDKANAILERHEVKRLQ